MSISIIIPTYNEGENITDIYNVISAIFSNINKEIIFVNDGSNDVKTKEELYKVSRQPDVKVINLPKNIGQQKAILEGMRASTKDVIGVIDCDMQDPPFILKEMYKLLTSSTARVVFGKRIGTEESLLRQMCSYTYNHLICRMLHIDYVNVSEFYCFKKNEIMICNEYIRGELLNHEDVAFYPYVRIKRHTGKSKYNLWKLTKIAIKGIRYTKLEGKIKNEK